VRQSIAGGAQDGSVLLCLDTEAVLDALAVGIVVLDAQLCAVYANALAQDMLAIQIKEVRGRPLAAFLFQPHQFLEAVRRTLESGEVVEFQLRVAKATVSERHVSVTSRISPMRDELLGPRLLLQVSGHGCIAPQGSSVE
jgi:PAS domain-containing protein